MACTCDIADIERECGKNAGGVKPLIHTTCEDEVSTIGAATDHEVSTITMRAAASPITKGYFRTWEPSRKDADFNSEQDENGVWKTNAKYFFPKQTAAKSDTFNNLGEDNNIAVVYDMNGKKRILGELGNPANIRTKEVTTPRNGYEVTFTWESQYSPYFFTGTPDVSPS